jgi:hypothetical protein
MDAEKSNTNRLMLPIRPGLSFSPANNTPSSNIFDDSSSSPLSSRMLKRPQRPRAQTGARPKSMIALSTYPYLPRTNKKTPRNVDDMDIDGLTTNSSCFIDALIQQIQNESVQPSATDQPRQNKRWSVTPPLNTYFHEEEVTPEREKAAIARYRHARALLPKDEWPKLESKHRIAIAALKKIEESDAMDAGLDITLVPESSMNPPTYEESLEVARSSDIVSTLRPEALEALAFTHTPNPQAVRPVGRNGLELENINRPSLVRHPECNAAAWERWQHLEGVADLQYHAFLGARLAAYSFDNGDIFNIHDPFVQHRLRQVEECWNQNKAAMNVETAFWNAVFERQYQPDQFTQRDAYLRLANAVEFAAKLFVYNRSDSEVHNQIFNRYLTAAFDCPEEDQGELAVDIPALANVVLNFDPRPGREQASMMQRHGNLGDVTERLGSLRFG